MKQKSRQKKVKSAIIILVLLLMLAAFAYMMLRNRQSTADSQSATQENSSQAEETLSPFKSANPPVAKTDDQKPKPTIEILKTYQEANNDLVVQTAVRGTGEGTCQLKLEGSSTIIKQAEVLYQATYSTCTGFLVSAAEIPSAGTWKMTLSLEQGGNVISQTSKDITVMK